MGESSGRSAKMVGTFNKLLHWVWGGARWQKLPFKWQTAGSLPRLLRIAAPEHPLALVAGKPRYDACLHADTLVEAPLVAALAQLVEHIIRNDGVTGSSPVSGTIDPIIQ